MAMASRTSGASRMASPRTARASAVSSMTVRMRMARVSGPAGSRLGRGGQVRHARVLGGEDSCGG